MTNEEAIAYFKECNERLVSVAKDENVYNYEKQVIEADCMRRTFEANEKVIKALEQTRWIPVSERLPEDHKDVLICLSSDQICIGCYNSHKLPFSNNVIGWGASYAHNWCSGDVIAWMPLPEPYKEENNGE